MPQSENWTHGIIAPQDFSNPEIAKHLNFYPEETDGPISEVWQADRWKEFSPSELTPMYSRGMRRFYIDEVAQLDTGEYVIPCNWIIRKKVLTADCLDVVVSPVSLLLVSCSNLF